MKRRLAAALFACALALGCSKSNDPPIAGGSDTYSPKEAAGRRFDKPRTQTTATRAP